MKVLPYHNIKHTSNICMSNVFVFFLIEMLLLSASNCKSIFFISLLYKNLSMYLCFSWMSFSDVKRDEVLLLLSFKKYN